jgi:hypothetical protein
VAQGALSRGILCSAFEFVADGILSAFDFDT